MFEREIGRVTVWVEGCLLVVDGRAGEPDSSLMATEMMGTLGPSSCRVSGVITAETSMTRTAR